MATWKKSLFIFLITPATVWTMLWCWVFNIEHKPTWNGKPME